MVTALSVTHGFTTTSWSSSYSKELKANIGHVLLYGIIIAIPVTLIAGPIFNKFAQNSSHLLIREGDISALGSQKNLKHLKCQVLV